MASRTDPFPSTQHFASGEGVTILMVDDDEIDVMGMERAFRHAKLGNPIVVASDGLAALGLLRDGHTVPRPFLIVLDINMPRMTGLEFLDELRADPQLRDSLVFILSTSKAEEDKHRAYQRNVAGYLLKQRSSGGFVNAAGLLDQYQRCVEFP